MGIDVKAYAQEEKDIVRVVCWLRNVRHGLPEGRFKAGEWAERISSTR